MVSSSAEACGVDVINGGMRNAAKRGRGAFLNGCGIMLVLRSGEVRGSAGLQEPWRGQRLFWTMMVRTRSLREVYVGGREGGSSPGLRVAGAMR